MQLAAAPMAPLATQMSNMTVVPPGLNSHGSSKTSSTESRSRGAGSATSLLPQDLWQGNFVQLGQNTTNCLFASFPPINNTYHGHGGTSAFPVSPSPASINKTFGIDLIGAPSATVNLPPWNTQQFTTNGHHGVHHSQQKRASQQRVLCPSQFTFPNGLPSLMNSGFVGGKGGAMPYSGMDAHLDAQQGGYGHYENGMTALFHPQQPQIKKSSLTTNGHQQYYTQQHHQPSALHLTQNGGIHLAQNGAHHVAHTPQYHHRQTALHHPQTQQSAQMYMPSQYHHASQMPHQEPRAPTLKLRNRVTPGMPSNPAHFLAGEEVEEVFARKVFVGGLPIDVSEQEIASTFSVFGKVLVDWPRRSDGLMRSGRGSRHYDDDEYGGSARAATGYVFLVFEEERSVQWLVDECYKDGDKYYLFVSSPTMRDKPVQVRPWRLTDMEYKPNPNTKMDSRRTVFIGGVPRPTRASELAACLERLYGPVAYAGIDIDPELKYPKGAARVTFASTTSFIAAIGGRFVHVKHAETQKRVEIKPYVMDEQMCDECEGKLCFSRYAPYFCGDVNCLQYYCEMCWDHIHYQNGSKRSDHRPLVRMGDQTKILPVPPHHNTRSRRGNMGGCGSGGYTGGVYGQSFATQRAGGRYIPSLLMQ